MEFFELANKVGEATASPFSIALAGLSADVHTLTARATDSAGLSKDSAPINVAIGTQKEKIVLFAIDDQTVWRYDRSGSDLGTAWREPKYDDSKWPQGKALIADESTTVVEPIRTPISRFNDAGDHITTFYVRGHFNYPKGSIADGAAFDFSTFFSDHENAYTGPLDISSASLVQGDNVFAVEVHQASSGSSDLVFGAELKAIITGAAPPVTTAPQFTKSTRNADGTLTFEWTGGGTLQAAPAITGPWQDVTGATSPYKVTPTGPMLFGRIKK